MVNEIKINTPNEFDFPFPPYVIQRDFMKNLFFTLEYKKLGIFESPTGTGKSLSIICGALKWLQERNNSDQQSLSNLIQELETKKKELESDTIDWLNSQAEEIQITKKLNLLKLKQTNIIDYQKKIEDINTKKPLSKHKKIWKINKSKVEDTRTEIKENVEKNEIYDDYLLEEQESKNESSSSEEEEENTDNKYEPIKILICSRTHSQLSQLIGEIIKSPYGQNTRAVTLASRQYYCINSSVNKLKNLALLNDRCLDLQKKASKTEDENGKVIKRRKRNDCRCPFKKQTAIDELKDQALLQICDVEDLVDLGEQLNGCPYYASRKAAEDSQIILIPYNTLLHKATRDANAIKLRNNVVIIDEAHNLLEALAQMYSSEVNLEQLELISIQLKNYKERFNKYFAAPNLLSVNQLIFVVKKLLLYLGKNSNDIETKVFTVQNFVLEAEIDNFNIFKLIKFCKDSRIAQKIHSYYLKNPEISDKVKPMNKNEGFKKFLSSIQKGKVEKVEDGVEKSEEKPKINVGNPFLPFAQFMESLTYSYNDGRIIIYQNKDKKLCKLTFLLLNPAERFKDIVSEARSVIVAGGTMKPLSEFRQRLFMNAGATLDRIVHFSCDHVIPKENILPLILTKGRENENLLFNFENRLLMGNVLKYFFQDICKIIPGGVVVFFPSYKYESWVWDQIKNVSFGREIFREPQDSGCVDSVLESYASAIKKSKNRSALLFSVVGGKLSEGLNFSDDLGRCVVVVGLPYGNVNSPELKEKMSYLDKTNGPGSGKSFYEALCSKAVNQCIGRAVRHKNDYATMILLDVRYDRQSNKTSLPDWIKKSLQTCEYSQTLKLIDEFFKGKNNLK